MDIKTFEYMNERVAKFNDLEIEKDAITKLNEHLEKHDIVQFETNVNVYSLNKSALKGIKGQIKLAIIETMEKRLQEISKEQEEI